MNLLRKKSKGKPYEQVNAYNNMEDLNVRKRQYKQKALRAILASDSVHNRRIGIQSMYKRNKRLLANLSKSPVLSRKSFKIETPDPLSNDYLAKNYLETPKQNQRPFRNKSLDLTRKIFFTGNDESDGSTNQSPLAQRKRLPRPHLVPNQSKRNNRRSSIIIKRGPDQNRFRTSAKSGFGVFKHHQEGGGSSRNIDNKRGSQFKQALKRSSTLRQNGFIPHTSSPKLNRKSRKRRRKGKKKPLKISKLKRLVRMSKKVVRQMCPNMMDRMKDKNNLMINETDQDWFDMISDAADRRFSLRDLMFENGNESHLLLHEFYRKQIKRFNKENMTREHRLRMKKFFEQFKQKEDIELEFSEELDDSNISPDYPSTDIVNMHTQQSKISLVVQNSSGAEIEEEQTQETQKKKTYGSSNIVESYHAKAASSDDQMMKEDSIYKGDDKVINEKSISSDNDGQHAQRNINLNYNVPQITMNDEKEPSFNQMAGASEAKEKFKEDSVTSKIDLRSRRELQSGREEMNDQYLPKSIHGKGFSSRQSKSSRSHKISGRTEYQPKNSQGQGFTKNKSVFHKLEQAFPQVKSGNRYASLFIRALQGTKGPIDTVESKQTANRTADLFKKKTGLTLNFKSPKRTHVPQAEARLSKIGHLEGLKKASILSPAISYDGIYLEDQNKQHQLSRLKKTLDFNFMNDKVLEEESKRIEKSQNKIFGYRSIAEYKAKAKIDDKNYSYMKRKKLNRNSRPNFLKINKRKAFERTKPQENRLKKDIYYDSRILGKNHSSSLVSSPFKSTNRQNGEQNNVVTPGKHMRNSSLPLLSKKTTSKIEQSHRMDILLDTIDENQEDTNNSMIAESLKKVKIASKVNHKQLLKRVFNLEHLDERGTLGTDLDGIRNMITQAENNIGGQARRRAKRGRFKMMPCNWDQMKPFEMNYHYGKSEEDHQNIHIYKQQEMF